MVRNLSSTVDVGEAVQWSGVGARSVRGDYGKVSPSEGEVGPFGPALVKVDRCPTEHGSVGPGLGWDGEPGGECGKGNGAPFGGHGESCARNPFSNRGWASSLE